ncbi:tetratricopeptide repeat protein [Mucilaginibacter sp. ZT4R22]|uniref:Tetratricopeptide repeat protein n=1 Tax=Mucilaginibacter pankratovii TaxID=2772110 RepID=A0ABR7WNQ5_9SPHI|nr:tetratricopeptide repeat-containing sensor histidine kinase [Mucilaginibacter pankratovii]MBD1363004.1 tetratricopeptide repeat protein [Mucilaginibacter pankratovii]
METGLDKDSLKRKLSVMRADSGKVQTLIRLGQQYETNRPDSALYYYAAAGKLSAALHYPQGTLRYIANYTAVLNVQGKFKESLQLNLKAIAIARQGRLQRQLMKALNNTGAVYQYTEHYREAVNYYLQALPLVDSIGSLQERSIAYGNLCGLYRNLKQPQSALRYAQLALAFGEKNRDDYAVAMASTNLGNCLKDLGKVREAISSIERAGRLGRKLADDNIQETALINLGDAYLSLKQPAKYVPAFKAALPIARKISDVSGECFALHGIALGLFFQKEYLQAERLLNTSIAFARQHDQKEVWSRMLLLMSDVQIGLGRPEASQDYRGRYDSVSNVLLNAPLQKNIQELEARYGSERKQRQLLQKDLQLAGKQRWLVISLAGLAVLALVFMLVYRKQETLRVKAMLAGEQQERRRISQEMHDDMGSGLTRLLFLTRSLIAGHEAAPKISDAVNGLIRQMNEVIWMMNNERDTLESLVAYLRAACGEMLDAAGIAMIFKVPDKVPDVILTQEVRRNMYLAVKEAVHNACKHSGANTVTIAILTEKGLAVSVQDNGRGLATAGTALGNGLGNMRQRMENIGGNFEMVSEAGTTLLRFSVPISI